jgi:hypothetical protein
MLRHGELIYGLIVALDIENFSRLDTLDQSIVQARLRQVLDVAATQSCLDRTKWHLQPRGDGELAVLPPDTDVAWVVANFTHHIAEALKAYGPPRLRLRISMHHGTLAAGEFGPAGDAPIVACRLLDARTTRRTLATANGDVVVVVSQRLYRDVICTRFHGLQPDWFRPMRVSSKGTTYLGYICVGSPRRVENDHAGR